MLKDSSFSGSVSAQLPHARSRWHPSFLHFPCPHLTIYRYCGYIFSYHGRRLLSFLLLQPDFEKVVAKQLTGQALRAMRDAIDQVQTRVSYNCLPNTLSIFWFHFDWSMLTKHWNHLLIYMPAFLTYVDRSVSFSNLKRRCGLYNTKYVFNS